uniref:UDENN FLCN/SMCR8-type domain-containing protein n=1 Tax=Angiostrongylus cantonensis TaxID=6313 RepID=A0A0K0CSP6_ANGCA
MLYKVVGLDVSLITEKIRRRDQLVRCLFVGSETFNLVCFGVDKALFSAGQCQEPPECPECDKSPCNSLHSTTIDNDGNGKISRRHSGLIDLKFCKLPSAIKLLIFFSAKMAKFREEMVELQDLNLRRSVAQCTECKVHLLIANSTSMRLYAKALPFRI